MIHLSTFKNLNKNNYTEVLKFFVYKTVLETIYVHQFRKPVRGKHKYLNFKEILKNIASAKLHDVDRNLCPSRLDGYSSTLSVSDFF